LRKIDPERRDLFFNEVSTWPKSSAQIFTDFTMDQKRLCPFAMRNMKPASRGCATSCATKVLTRLFLHLCTTSPIIRAFYTVPLAVPTAWLSPQRIASPFPPASTPASHGAAALLTTLPIQIGSAITTGAQLHLWQDKAVWSAMRVITCLSLRPQRSTAFWPQKPKLIWRRPQCSSAWWNRRLKSPLYAPGRQPLMWVATRSGTPSGPGCGKLMSPWLAATQWRRISRGNFQMRSIGTLGSGSNLASTPTGRITPWQAASCSGVTF